MAQVPFPINAESVEAMRFQVYELIRKVYEDRIGGLALGDVFEDVGDVLTLSIADSGGLEKSSFSLKVAVNATGGIQLTSTGVSVKPKSGGGLATDANGLYITGTAYGFGGVHPSTGDDLLADALGDTLNLTGGTGVTVTGVGTTDTATIALAETWDDIRVNPGSFDRPGVTDPTIVAYDVNGGGVSTYLWQFQKNAVASFTIQMPHGYKQGTDIYCHIHWTPGANGTTESGKNVGWKVDYSWANIEGNFPTMLTLDLSDACDGTDHKHQMTPDVVIDGHTATKNISSMLICNVKRTDTGTDDTWAGTASGALPMLLEIDFHYQVDSTGSSARTSK